MLGKSEIKKVLIVGVLPLSIAGIIISLLISHTLAAKFNDLAFLIIFGFQCVLLGTILFLLLKGWIDAKFSIGILMLVMFTRLALVIILAIVFKKYFDTLSNIHFWPVIIYYLIGLVTENMVLNYLFKKIERRG